MKENLPGSVFPIKLLMGYIVFLSLTPTLISFADFGNIEASIEDWNLVLGWSLALCVPLLWVIYLAIRHFMKIPIFAVSVILFAVWHISITLADYHQEGFDTRFDIDLNPQSFVINAILFAIPFVVIYLCWRFWPRPKPKG